MKKRICGPTSDDYLKKFKPLQVEVKSDRKEDFEYAMRTFKAMVQKERILAEYKMRQQYEKPSVKKRRKKREAQSKMFVAEQKRIAASKESV